MDIQNLIKQSVGKAVVEDNHVYCIIDIIHTPSDEWGDHTIYYIVMDEDYNITRYAIITDYDDNIGMVASKEVGNMALMIERLEQSR